MQGLQVKGAEKVESQQAVLLVEKEEVCKQVVQFEDL